MHSPEKLPTVHEFRAKNISFDRNSLLVHYSTIFVAIFAFCQPTQPNLFCVLISAYERHFDEIWQTINKYRVRPPFPIVENQRNFHVQLLSDRTGSEMKYRHIRLVSRWRVASDDRSNTSANQRASHTQLLAVYSCWRVIPLVATQPRLLSGVEAR